MRASELLANPKTTAYDYFVRSAEAVAASLALVLVASPVETVADVERAVESLVPDGGLLVPTGCVNDCRS